MLEAHVRSTAQLLLQRIQEATPEPLALEAMWDGDTSGWWLDLCVVTRRPREAGGFHYTSRPLMTLNLIDHETGSRLFAGLEGLVLPHAEAEVAQRVGRSVAETLGLPFWFPSPREREDSVPHWWEQELATPCEDCAMPLLPAAGSVLPREVCFSCQHSRERRRTSRAVAPGDMDEGGVLCVAHLGDQQVGPALPLHWSDAETLCELTAELGRPIAPSRDVSLTSGELKAFKGLITRRLERLRRAHRPPDKHFRGTTWTVPILGDHLVLNPLDSEHWRLAWLLDLSRALEQCKRGEALSFFVEQGLGPREYEVLGLLWQQGEREMELAVLLPALRLLDRLADLQDVACGLHAWGCLFLHSSTVRLTLKGRLVRPIGIRRVE